MMIYTSGGDKYNKGSVSDYLVVMISDKNTRCALEEMSNLQD